MTPNSRPAERAFELLAHLLENHLNSTDPIDTLVDMFPRLFRGQRPSGPSSLPEDWLKLAGRLFTEVDRMLDDDSASQFEVRQIKEKLGRLRVHFWLGPPFEEGAARHKWSPLREKISNLIRAEGDESGRTTGNANS